MGNLFLILVIFHFFGFATHFGPYNWVTKQLLENLHLIYLQFIVAF